MRLLHHLSSFVTGSNSASRTTLGLAAAPRPGRCLQFVPFTAPTATLRGRAHSGAFRLGRTAGATLGPTLRIFRAPSPWFG